MFSAVPATVSVALIDETLPDQALLAESTGNATKIYFNPKTDSAAAVLNAAIKATDQLSSKINSLMVFSHGNAGNLSLGDQLITAKNVGQTATEWRELSTHLTKDASVDLFACDLAANPAGQQLLNKLHQLTSANVYGSTNLTGKGGDWTLEAHSQDAPVTPRLAANTAELATYPSDLLITISIPAAASPSTVTGTTTTLSVLMIDVLGSPIFTWSTTSKPTGSTVTFSNNATATAAITTATFNKSGNYSFTVNAVDGSASNSSSVNVTVNQTLTTINVTPATSSLSLNATQTFSATALDQFGTAISSQPTFTWSRLGVGSINSSTGVFSSGILAGSSTVSTTSGAISGTASVTVANAAPTVATAAAASSGTITANTVGLSVLGADDGGESNLTYSWAATTKPAGSSVTFSANGTNAAKASTATFFTAGSYTFTATITDGYGATTTSSVNVNVAQTLSSITVAPATPTFHLNQIQTFTDTGYDQFGNSMTTQPTVAWSLTNGSVGTIGSSTGSYNSGATPGSGTVDATASGITGADSVTVVNATPTIATAAAANPSTVTATTTALSVLGADDGGESNLIYTWATTSKPLGSTAPTFSANGTNAAKNSIATFSSQGVYILQVTVTDTFGASATSSVAVTVNLGNPNITVTAGTTAMNLNQTQAFTATAYDQFGNALLIQPVFTWSLGAGSVGSIGALTGIYNSGGTPGSATVVATSGAFSSSAAVSVTNAAPTVATAAASTPSNVTGTTALLSVLGADDGGESNLTYAWSATTKPTGATPTFSANATNGAKLSTVTFNKAGNYVFNVLISDGSLTTNSTVSVAVSQTTTSVSLTPATSSLNENQTQQFAAVAYDQFGIAMATQPTFAWTTGLLSVGTVNSTGLYTAPGLAGSATVIAASGLITGTASVTVTNAPPTVATPAAASPSTVTGTTTALSVLGADDGGESNLFYTWSATTKPTGSTVLFNANGVNSAKNVTATFSTAGSYVLTATISDGTYSVSSSVSVTVAQAVSSIIVSPSVATLHENATQQFTAVAYDSFGVALATQPTFVWSKLSGVGSINSSGLFSTATTTGSAVVQASSGGVNAVAAVTVTNAAPTVATAAAASPTTVTGTTSTLSVFGADDGGEANLTYTWAASVAPLGGTAAFSVNGTNAAKNSVVTFNKVGAYQLTATISDGTSTVSSTVAVTVVSTATTLTMTPATLSLNENSTQVFTAIAYDQFGAALVPQPLLTWSKASGIGTVSALGTYTSPAAAGSAVVQVAGGGLTSTAAVTVINAAPTIVTPAGALPATVTGTSTLLSVLATDDGGSSNLTYTWAATTAPTGGTATFSANGTNAAALSTATFNKAGSYVLTATISDGTNTITSAVSVTVSQTLTNITVLPANSSLQLNQSEQLTALAYDQFGNQMSPQPTLLWTVLGGGSVSQSGMYTAGGSPVSAIVYASNGLISGSAGISVSNATPTVATAAAANPVSVTGTTAALSVLGADDGGESHLSYTWSATTAPTGATPIFSLNGTNSAKNTTVTFNALGNYTFTATITDAYGASVTSAVSVTVSQTLTTLTVTPATKTLSVGSTYQFAATAYDQFGNAMTTQPTFTWAVASGGGTVSSTGLFTAGGAASNSTVTATSGAIAGSASVITVNSLAITTAVNPSGTSASLAILGLSGVANLAWSVTSQPTGGSATFDTTTGSTPTLSFSAAGNYTVQLGVTIAGVTTNVSNTFTVSQMLTTVTVIPATASIAENQSVTLLGTGFDQFGIPMLTQPTFTWSVNSGAGSVNSGGVYSSAGTPGTASVRATSGSVFGSASITTVNAPPTIVTPALASPTLITGTTTALSVLAADDGGEPALQYTWAVTNSPSGSAVTFSSNGNNAAKNTTATFNKAGAYIFSVTVTDGTNTVTSTAIATVVQTVTSIGISAAANSVNETTPDQLGASASDQFGNPILSQTTITWSETDGLGTVNSNGLFVAGTTPGTADVKASIGPIFADQLIAITHGAPTITMNASSPSPTVTGTSTTLNVLGNDENGESILNYTWVATAAPSGATVSFSSNGTNAAKNTTVTFSQVGSYTLKSIISNGLSSVISPVTVNVVQTLSGITASPATASLNLQQSQQITALGFDQFNNAMSTTPAFTWSVNSGVGSVSSTGVYSSGSIAGLSDVRVAAGGLHADTALTVINQAPTVNTAAAAAPALVSSVSTQLSALGADDNGESNLTYTWSATSVPAGAAPAFSLNDSNSAKNTTVYFDEAGSYVFSVAISDGTNSVTSVVPVTVVQTMSSISVIPPTASVPVATPQQLIAVANDQFGSAMSNQPTFNWTLPSGSGSVSSSGLYTAGSSDGIATIQANANGITTLSTMTVYGNPPSIITAASATPTTVTATTAELSITASTTSNAPLIFSWTITSAPAGANPQITQGMPVVQGIQSTSPASVQFNKAGQYTFQAEISDGVESSLSSVIVNVVPTLSGLTATASATQVYVGGTSQLTATGVDQFGMPIPEVANWSITSGSGSVDSNGLFQASATPGATTLSTGVGGFTAQATVTTNPFPLTISQPAMADTTTVAGTSVGLHARASEGSTGDTGLAYNWSEVSGPAGRVTSFTPNGTTDSRDTNATFSSAGTYLLQVTITDALGQSSNSTVAVAVNQTLTAVSVSVPTNTVTGGATVQATAVTTDQFGSPISEAFTWSVDAGSVGTVNANGLFTVGNLSGSSTVRANAGALSGASVINSTMVVTALQVTPSFTQPTARSVAGVLTATVTGDTNPDVSYDWQIVSQPVVKLKNKKVNAAPEAIFEFNDSPAAQTTPVTYTTAGNYIIKVTATDGAVSGTEEIPLTIGKAARVATLAVVAGIAPWLNADQVQGYLVTFSKPVNAATAMNLGAYGISQSPLPKGSTKNSIASVTYDATTYTAAVKFAQPLAVSSSTVKFTVFGVGKTAIKDATGLSLDGDASGQPGANFVYTATLRKGNYSQKYPDGSTLKLTLTGPGTLLVDIRPNSDPLVVIYGGNPATSVLTGTVTHRPKKFVAKAVAAILHADTVTVSLDDGIVLEG